MNECKYYDSHLETIAEYIRCLYNLDGCCTGGLLHVLLDDDNYDDKNILLCLKKCLLNPEKEESKIGQLICEEYLKLTIQQRRLLCKPYINGGYCLEKCEKCFVEIGNGLE